jgi:di/tricarboxylate transporter
MVLKAGDVLLLQASIRGFDTLRESQAVLIVEGLEQTIKHKPRVLVAMAIILAVVGLATLTSLSIVVLAITGAALMVATRCLRVDEAIRSLDFQVLLLLAGTIPLGRAMSETGLASAFVHQVVGVVGDVHPIVFLSAFYLMTSVTTEFLSNKATAVLLAPIALQLALQMGVDPKPFLMAICFAASASFATPIGYPTNLIVMGPGGYHFGDYLKIGVSMNILMWILATLLIPVFWPFSG